jgi:hypothetical protein
VTDKGDLANVEDAPPEPKKGLSTGVIVLIVIAIGAVVLVPCIIAMIAAIAIPNLIQARKHANEHAAIGALKTIRTCEAIFREADKDKNGVLDYGSLAQFGQTGLVDSVLASGTKQGYLFEAKASVATSEFLWFATARPAVPGTTGERYFCTNQSGVIFYRLTAPFPMNDDDCQIPKDALPVGR